MIEAIKFQRMLLQRRPYFIEKCYHFGKTVTTYGNRVERAPAQMEKMREDCQRR